MSSPLQNAIDVVVAFVDEYKAARDRWHKTPGNVIVWNARPPETLPRFDVPRFEELSRTVLIEAERLGLGDKLPQPDSSTFNPEATAPAFIGCINLPGYFGIGSGFVPMPTERWRDALLTLRALAEEALPAESTTTPAPGSAVDWDGLLASPPLSVPEIAHKLGQPTALVARTLSYFREQHDYGFIKDDDSDSGVTYRYIMLDVLPHLLKWYAKRVRKAAQNKPTDD
jgi:hypothetical protein